MSSLVDHKVVFDAVLRFDARGWSGNPPKVLDQEPTKIHLDKNGAPQEFVYGFFPWHEEPLPIEHACRVMGTLLKDELARANSPLRDSLFSGRSTLDVAISVDDDDLAMYSYVWPAEFVQLLSSMGLSLGASHYRQGPFSEVQRSTHL